MQEEFCSRFAYLIKSTAYNRKDEEGVVRQWTATKRLQGNDILYLYFVYTLIAEVIDGWTEGWLVGWVNRFCKDIIIMYYAAAGGVVAASVRDYK